MDYDGSFTRARQTSLPSIGYASLAEAELRDTHESTSAQTQTLATSLRDSELEQQPLHCQ